MKKWLIWGIQFVFLLNVNGRQPGVSDSFPPPGVASFVYDPATRSLLLIGSIPVIPDSVQHDIWKWNGTKWSVIKAKGPGSRDFFPASLNAKTGVVYAFGGIGAITHGKKGDLWKFNGLKWINAATNNTASRDHHAIVYADHLDAFVVYGGQTSDNNFDTTTWLVKGDKFIPLRIPGPGVRYHTALAYDRNRRKVMLYGGGQHPDEHWEFDGIKWEKIITTINPGKRFYHFMVYDDHLKAIILHGGWQNQDPRDPANNVTPVTWAWDGRAWTKIAEERIFPMAMGYDANRKVIVALGRTGNTPDADMGLWEFSNGQWNNKVNYGKWSTYDHVKAWIQTHPDDLIALAKYADLCQWQTKEFGEAENAYKKLVIAYPEQKAMLIDLALVLLMQGKLDEAERYLATVKEAGLINRNVYARLAGLLRMEDRIPVSTIYLEKALQLESKPGDYYQLGCDYAKMDNKDKAFENLNKAVDSGFNSKQQFERSADLERLRADGRWEELARKLK